MHRKSIAVVALALGALLAAGPAWAAPQGDGPPAAPPPSADTASAAPEANLTGLTSVNAGYYLSCARTSTGQARCWGDNGYGSLGDGTTSPRTLARTVRNATNTGPLTGVVQVAAGTYHACALLTNKQVRCWGYNSDGQLGNGDEGTDSPLPVPVRNAGNTGNLTNVTQITAETYGTCALLTNDQVRCWGDNDYGQLGDGHTGDAFDSDLPVAVKAVSGPGNLTGVGQVESGYDNSCAVLNNGQARCWGYQSTYGTLGNDSASDSNRPVVVKNVAGNGPLTNATQVSTGGYISCARLGNGQARCWGWGDTGGLGNGDDATHTRPVVVVNASGSGALAGIQEIYAGYEHVCARVAGGQVRCWGATEYGEVGDGTAPGNSSLTRLRPRPVKNGNGTANLTGVTQLHTNQYHTCVRLSSGQARCWGYGEYYQLGDGGETTRSLPVRVQV
jgi:alpha-tubulin suppressor-like RCC1 family protein